MSQTLVRAVDTVGVVAPEEWGKALASCGERFFVERGIPGTFDAERSLFVWTALSRAMPTLMVGAYCGDEIVGGIGAVIMQDEHSDYRFGAETFWYVHAEHRGGTAGVRCLMAAEEWAKHSHGMKEFRLGEFRLDGLPGSNQHYHRMGYRPFYTVYRKEL